MKTTHIGIFALFQLTTQRNHVLSALGGLVHDNEYSESVNPLWSPSTRSG